MIIDLLPKRYRVINDNRLTYFKSLIGPKNIQGLFSDKLLLFFLSSDDSCYCQKAAGDAMNFLAHRLLVDDRLCFKMWGTTSIRHDLSSRLFSLAKNWRSAHKSWRKSNGPKMVD